MQRHILLNSGGKVGPPRAGGLQGPGSEPAGHTKGPSERTRVSVLSTGPEGGDLALFLSVSPLVFHSWQTPNVRACRANLNRPLQISKQKYTVPWQSGPRALVQPSCMHIPCVWQSDPTYPGVPCPSSPPPWHLALRTCSNLVTIYQVHLKVRPCAPNAGIRRLIGWGGASALFSGAQDPGGGVRIKLTDAGFPRAGLRAPAVRSLCRGGARGPDSASGQASPVTSRGAHIRAGPGRVKWDWNLFVGLSRVAPEATESPWGWAVNCYYYS